MEELLSDAFETRNLLLCLIYKMTVTRPQRDHQILGHHRKDEALLDIFIRLAAEYVKVMADHTDRHLDLRQG